MPFNKGQHCCDGNKDADTGHALNIHSVSCEGSEIPCPLKYKMPCSERRMLPNKLVMEVVNAVFDLSAPGCPDDHPYPLDSGSHCCSRLAGSGCAGAQVPCPWGEQQCIAPGTRPCGVFVQGIHVRLVAIHVDGGRATGFRFLQ